MCIYFTQKIVYSLYPRQSNLYTVGWISIQKVYCKNELNENAWKLIRL